MRKTLAQGIPELLLFTITVFLIILLSDLQSVDFFRDPQLEFSFNSIIIFLLLGFMPSFYSMIKRVGSQGLSISIASLIFPGLIFLYLALLPYFSSTLGYNNLPGNLFFGESLNLISHGAALWLGSLISRSFGRPQDRHVSYLRAPYEV